MAKKEKDLEVEKQEDVAMTENNSENETVVDDEKKLITEIANLKDKSLRLQADFDNFRKRNAGVVSKTREETTKDVLVDLLTVADNLERALDVIKDESTKAGIQLVMNQVLTIFKKYGVLEMDALDKEFDPNFHNAIMQEDNSEQAGKVTTVFQKGYMIKNDVLRYATVKVAK